MRELIKTYLCDIVRKLNPDFGGSVLVEISGNKQYGDYTTNIAFMLSKITGESPQKIAENLVKGLNNELISLRETNRVVGKIENFNKIESVNGFVNFFLSDDYLRAELGNILKQKNKYGFSKNEKRIKINIEFISANPTGPLTIGNGRGGFYGDVLANILESQGHQVTREYYINDRGEQVLALGRSIKLAQNDLSISETIPADTSSVSEIDKRGEEKIYKGEYIKELAKEIDRDLNESETGQKTLTLILKKYIKPAIKHLEIKFNVWFSEKTLYKGNNYAKIMEDLMRKDFIYPQDGATWMKTSELGDSEDRVLIKSDGSETYFLSDILYHFDKFKIRKFDKAIDIWGADHHGYAPRLKAALAVLDIPKDNLEIIITQLARLVEGGKEVKISKRAGTFVTLEELIAEVGLDAARFFFLMYSPDTHMNFDMKIAKERSEKNPVYYAQYAHARIASILAKIKNQKLNLKITNKNLKLLKEKEELNLVRKLIEFPELLSEIAINYEVHRLPRYVLELAREFHNFYEKEKVITEDKNLTAARLGLVAATKVVLANSLNLMGITALDKM